MKNNKKNFCSLQLLCDLLLWNSVNKQQQQLQKKKTADNSKEIKLHQSILYALKLSFVQIIGKSMIKLQSMEQTHLFTTFSHHVD